MNHQAYIRRETAVSIIINSLLSALFFWLVFGGVDPVPAWGVGNWVFDFIPQGFMIALMGTLVPGLLTGKAIRAGRIRADGPPSRLPGNLLARALLLAVTASLLGAALIALIMASLDVAQLSAKMALLVKIAYGAVLASIVTPLGLRRALARRD